MDQESDPRHHHQHHDAERIELEGEIGTDRSGRDPVVDDIDVARAVRMERVVLDDGNRSGDRGAERCQQRDGGHEAFAEPLAEQAVQQKAGERQ